MSRIAKMPIPIPAGVQVEIQSNTIKVSGPNGILSQTYKESDVAVKMDNNEINESPCSSSYQCRAISCTISSLV
ncbi:MAG: 50S ribosomal protein L6, partial [Burkholderiaceae bacterium]